MQHYFQLHYKHISDKGFKRTYHYVWSDGCASQFKSSKPWYFVSKYPNLTCGCKMMRSFFESEHGKGPHDGVGVVIKRFIWCKQLNAHSIKLQNAAKVVNLFCSNLCDCFESSYVGRKGSLHRVFWYVDENDVDCSSPMFACDKVEGTQKIHCIFSTNKNVLIQLLVKPLACFCAFCIDGKWLECPNMKWTGDWISRHTESGVLLILLMFNFKNSHLVYMFSDLVKTMKFLILLKDVRVSSNNVVYELPNDVAVRIHSVIVVLDDID